MTYLNNGLRLRDHASACFAVGFVASIATMIFAMTAKVGPQAFTYLTWLMAAVTIVSVVAGIGLFAVCMLKGAK